MAVIGNGDAVDSIGPTNCLPLIEREELKKDQRSARAARRQVAEVHTGRRPPPKQDNS
jgi:hypothetical protein